MTPAVTGGLRLKTLPATPAEARFLPVEAAQPVCSQGRRTAPAAPRDGIQAADG